MVHGCSKRVCYEINDSPIKDKEAVKFEPFKLSHDPLLDEWYVYLEHPDQKDDFVVPYKSSEHKDCEIVLYALNTLIQAHWDSKYHELTQIIACELSDVEP